MLHLQLSRCLEFSVCFTLRKRDGSVITRQTTGCTTGEMEQYLAPDTCSESSTQTDSGAHPASQPMARGGYCTETNLLWRAPDNSPSSNSEAKDARSYTSIPIHTFREWCLINQSKSHPHLILRSLATVHI